MSSGIQSGLHIFYFVEIMKTFCIPPLFSMILCLIWIRTNKSWTRNNRVFESPPGSSLLAMSLFLLAFLCFATRELQEIPNLPAPDDLLFVNICFVQGMNSVRGTTGRPSDGSVYSVTSRGEVLLFDPEAARNSGEEENSVVGEQFYSWNLSKKYR
jgi:hypothetical protein